MNKFYQKYKDLFPVQQKPPYAFLSYGDSYNNKSLPKSLASSPYVAQKQPLYKKQSQHRQLFRNYARNELSSGDSLWTGLRQKASQKSPINREMEESILPRLRGLDEQIERRLERFRTEKAEKVRDYVRGKSGKQGYDDSAMFRVGDKGYIERRGEQKVFRTSKRHATEANRQDISEILDRRRKDSSHQHMPRQFTKHTTTKKSAHTAANIPTTTHTPSQSKLSHNIFSHDFTYHMPQRKPSRLFDPISKKLRTQLYSDTQNPENSQLSRKQLQESYISEYQRSYSNKKVGVCGQGEEEGEIVERESGMENGGGVKRREYDSGRDKGDGGKQDSMGRNVGLRWKEYRTAKKPLAHYIKHIGQPSESQRQYALDKTLPQDKRSVKSKENPQPHPSPPSSSPLLTFSQHQPNQFAFINSRLSDIHNFQNYYHHTFINEYKQAIIRRLQHKRRLQQRRGRLREVIMKDGGM